MSRPLAEVIATNPGGYVPVHPERRPWVQGGLEYELAWTGNAVTVPLRVADRVRLHGLDRPSCERDELEPTDWMPVGWARA